MRDLLLLPSCFWLQRSQFADKMAPKSDVEGVVNPIGNLEEDDDPFLVSAPTPLQCLMDGIGKKSTIHQN
jgi:hypothetical protein